MHHPTDRITHTTAFVTPVVEHWMEREIVVWQMTTDRAREETRFLIGNKGSIICIIPQTAW